ncbi:MAG: TetR family transcriptional regulator [Chloroflexi bacterium HGW-Chloroflexi-10]|nr:MAG: TetR family transcriptional regulator [Chloroflexi bacterium HGW-Chloroflexi-10]
MARSVGVTREKLITVAGQLADTHGLEHLTLAQVANELGIRVPSVYNHVDGIPGLHRELAILGGRQLMEKINRAVIGKYVDEAVIALAQVFYHYANGHPGLYAASVRAPAADDLVAQQFVREIVEVVLAVLAPLQLEETNAIHAVRGLRSIIHGFVMLERAGGFGLPINREESFQFLINTFIIGLRTSCK